MSTITRPRIAVTMGDPAGIGPEICLRLMHDRTVNDVCIPVVIGDAAVLTRVAAGLGLPFTAPVLPADAWDAVDAQAVVLDQRLVAVDDVRPGVVQAACGAAAFGYVTRAIDAGLAGRVAAIATAPLNKEALHAAGHRYPGHTEIFAERMAARRSCMLLTSDELTCSFVTVHVGYHQVPGLLSVERVREVIELTAEAMWRLRGRAPRLVVCGLNPHAGEHGLFGQHEEERFIIPAITAARAAGIAVEGPLPPDTAFLPTRRRTTDAFVCQYHDQGHIPLKALAFDQALNTTLGLPVVRTSVDHGTAFDIAWQGVANPTSLVRAVLLAARLSAPHQAHGVAS
jgi:4-hydroxythreonine-4-phosphate dehydrogenase